MSVKEAVRFSYLSNQLSKSEQQIFILQLLNKPNNVITKSLTKYFIDNLNDAESANHIISAIIRKREDITFEPQQFKLDTIPQQLIGHIASFADQYSYTKLSIASRSVYLGCNSPNMLQRLYLYQDNHWKNIKLTLYPSTKCIAFLLDKFDTLSSSATTTPIFNQLNEVELVGNYDKPGNQGLNKFLENNFLNLSNVTKLHYQLMDNYGNNKELFTKLISNIPKLEYLGLTYDFTCDIDVNAIMEMLPNLRGLKAELLKP